MRKLHAKRFPKNYSQADLRKNQKSQKSQSQPRRPKEVGKRGQSRHMLSIQDPLKDLRAFQKFFSPQSNLRIDAGSNSRQRIQPNQPRQPRHTGRVKDTRSTTIDLQKF